MAKQHEYTELVRTVLTTRFEPSKPLAFVHTYGCQGNVSDGERIKGILETLGYGFTDDVEKADLILYNTCAVREHAEDRIYGNVGAIKRLKKTNPNLIIALCGCMMQQKRVVDKIRKSYPFVDLVFGTHVIHRIPELVYRVLCTGKKVYECPDEAGVIAEDLPIRRDGSIKGWLPIMYGCNNFCSYCIVPYVRGRERSREPEDV
ncbi:MAG TPA: tRNA (N6-isopentenyl adenosine(37)-C2)-methylthiotransferase MiaB, partial [Ruminococcaceae bacterium]|nr:tRNA (N6-isopentenyl adenosine(37)-C2)-methylthiotransferase MiaB [Oscillospiraceae bacterium]